jgi:hypothetical protein
MRTMLCVRRSAHSADRMPRLPATDPTVSDLCLGADVFGWTADHPTSFTIADRYRNATASPQQPASRGLRRSAT